MDMYLRAKFEVSSRFLTSFREGLISPPPPQNEPLLNDIEWFKIYKNI